MLKITFILILLTPLSLLAKQQRYLDHHNFFYSKKVTVTNYSQFKQALRGHDLIEDKWIMVVLRMNGIDLDVMKKLNYPKEIYLPQAPISKKSNYKMKNKTPVTGKEKLIKYGKRQDSNRKRQRPSNYSYLIHALIGKNSVQGNDRINSDFEVTFFRLAFDIERKYKDFYLHFSIAMDSYLSVDYESDFGSEKSNTSDQYFNFNTGIGRTINDHTLSLNYDNINYMLTSNDQTKISLDPTRVDRISITDSYKLTDRYFLIGNLGFFPSIFSGASGYGMSLGILRKLGNKFSASAQFTHDDINKSSIQNNCNIISLSASLSF